MCSKRNKRHNFKVFIMIINKDEAQTNKHVFVTMQSSKYFNSNADTLVTECDVTVIVLENTIATNMTNTTATSNIKTVLINFHSKKERDCYILLTVLLLITL